MPLSRKYYNAIAEILSHEFDDADYYYKMKGKDSHRQARNTVCEVTKELSRYFLEDNPRFSKVRFITAVGCENIIKTGDL